jgi:hypothetical protein
MPLQTLWTLAEIFILVNLGLAYKLDRIVYFRLTYDKLAALLGKGQRQVSVQDCFPVHSIKPFNVAIPHGFPGSMY